MRLVDLVVAEEKDKLLQIHGEVSKEGGAPSWAPGGMSATRFVYRITTSTQPAAPLALRAHVDKSPKGTVFVIDTHSGIYSRSRRSEVGSGLGTGEVSAALSGIVSSIAALSADSFDNLFTYFSSLTGTTEPLSIAEVAETTEPPSVADPHLEAVEWIKTATGLSWERVASLIGVTRQAIYLWKQGGTIADEHRRRLLKVRDVLERAAKRNLKNGGLSAWLDTPRGADARTPADLLEAGEIGKARLLALSGPSPGVKVPPEWARRGAREAYLNSRERVRALPPELDGQLLGEVSEDEDD